ncbi:4-hydroxy-tetrahydrodipicolinate synthase [Modicisalibacter muralis]|uniref:4-hydroxy-tetrahydrodipicolinate synthase n=1 Tax=Modicisalibacter muralis TaxID=119000 RepID=A0A1G9KMH6_9GAMM|nr:dihydrodipicolinate synthase family protein [Halomonas muralis]SDL50958.1 4-hydroxy-tetrahydrodipicolinate synthase [Halomonas muralis]
MSSNAAFTGVLSPVVTPFDSDLNPDPQRWITHCRWLLSQQCGLALFGTNSEANSLSVAERLSLLDEIAASGLDMARMMPGTGACSIPDAVELTGKAVDIGCGGVLMLPPFYYKGVSDEGLFGYYSEVIQRVGSHDLRIYLYHIPQVAQIPISLALIERLLKEYPETVVGIKDSSGDWSNTQTMLERFDDFAVFAGSESFLLKTLQAGGAGCISATANINPAAIHDLYVNWRSDDADERQRSTTAFRESIAQLPMIPALKATIATVNGDDGWARVRPPLVELDGAQRGTLDALLKRHEFSMPGWGMGS